MFGVIFEKVIDTMGEIVLACRYHYCKKRYIYTFTYLYMRTYAHNNTYEQSRGGRGRDFGKAWFSWRFFLAFILEVGKFDGISDGLAIRSGMLV